LQLVSFENCNSGNVVILQDALSRGAKILVAYLLLEYIIPLVLNLAFDTQPFFRLPIDSSTILLTLIFLISVYIFAVFIANYTPSVVPNKVTPLKPLSRSTLLVFSIVCIVVGILNFIDGMAQWRYGPGIRSGNSILMLIAALQSLLPVVCYWVLITDHKMLVSRKSRDIKIKLLLSSALVLSMNGLSGIIMTALFLFVFIMPRVALQVLFVNKNGNKKHRSSEKTIIFFFLIPVLVASLFSLGLYTKSGTKYSLKDSVATYTGIEYLVNRHSVHLAIAAASIDDGPDINTLSIPLKTIVYRSKVLLGIEPNAKKPEISTFSRLALVQFANYENVNPRGGASPGLIGSITMIFPLMFAAIFLFIAVILCVKSIDFILCRQPYFSWIGAFCFAYIPLRFVLDSPFDILLPGPTLLVVLFLLFMSFRREKV